MNWKEYQENCKKTMVYESYKEKISCSALEIVDEISELMEHMNSISDAQSLKLELGDILYPMAILSSHYDINIETDGSLCSPFEDWMILAGKISGIIKKSIRDDHYNLTDTKDRRVNLEGNMTLLMGYIKGFCNSNNWNFSDILQLNVEKLASRMKRGTIQGDGDFR